MPINRPRAILLPLLAVLACLPYPWALAASSINIYGHSAVLVQNVLYIYGGDILTAQNTTSTQNTLYALHLNQTFSQQDPPWNRSVAHNVSALSNLAAFPGPDGVSFVIFGGGSSFNLTSPNPLYQYSVATRSWSTPASTGSPPSQRRMMSAVYKQDTQDVFVFGGFADCTVGMATSNLYNSVYDLNERNQFFWHDATGSGFPTARWGHTASLLRNGKMLILGGFVSNSNITAVADLADITAVADLANIPVYDTIMMTWSSNIVAQGLLPAARAGHSAVVTSDQRIIIFGGQDMYSVLSDMVVLNTSTNEWSMPSVGGTAPSARAYHSATLAGDIMVVAFGWSTVGGGVGGTYFFNVSTFKWVDTYIPTNLPPLVNVSLPSTATPSTFSSPSIFSNPSIFLTPSIFSSPSSTIAPPVIDPNASGSGIAAVPSSTIAPAVIDPIAPGGGIVAVVGDVVGIALGSLLLVSTIMFILTRKPKFDKNQFVLSDVVAPPRGDYIDADFTDNDGDSDYGPPPIPPPHTINYHHDNRRGDSDYGPPPIPPPHTVNYQHPAVGAPPYSPDMSAAAVAALGVSRPISPTSADSYTSQSFNSSGTASHLTQQFSPVQSSAAIYGRAPELSLRPLPTGNNYIYDVRQLRYSTASSFASPFTPPSPSPSPAVSRQALLQHIQHEEEVPRLTMQLLHEEPLEGNMGGHEDGVFDDEIESEGRRRFSALTKALSYANSTRTESTGGTSVDRGPQRLSSGTFGKLQSDTPTGSGGYQHTSQDSGESMLLETEEEEERGREEVDFRDSRCD